MITGKFSAVADLTWGGWVEGKMAAVELGVPYVRMQSANHLFMQAADDLLRKGPKLKRCRILWHERHLQMFLHKRFLHIFFAKKLGLLFFRCPSFRCHTIIF